MHLGGLYRGTVVDSQDPSASGRVKVLVPELGTNTAWALVCVPFGGQQAGIVGAGTPVIVGFERGDPSRPVVLGRVATS